MSRAQEILDSHNLSQNELTCKSTIGFFTTPKQQPQQEELVQSNPKNSNVATVWITANPKYKPGEPLLSEEALKAAGPS